MDIFIAQLFAFGLIVFILNKYVVPPVRKMMAQQQDDIRDQIASSESAAAKLAEAQEARAKALSEAESEAARIREEARADAQRISEQLREQADAEIARIKNSGADHIELHKRSLVRHLQTEIATSALAQAEEKVNERLAAPGELSASVDRFIDELERMAEGSLAAGSRGVGNEGRS
jgi:ATP synthase F0 subunit b